MKRLNRRTVVRFLGVGGAVVATKMSGFIPELALAGAPTGDPAAAGKAAAQKRARELRGAELQNAIARASRSPAVGILNALTTHKGFTWADAETAGASIDGSDGSAIGESLVTTLHDRKTGRSARLVYQVSGDQVRPALALWEDAAPDRLTVFGVREQAAQMLGTIIFRRDDVVIDDIVTGRRVLPLRPPARSAVKGPGLAAIGVGPAVRTAQQTCTENCGWIVGAYCGINCEYIFYVSCFVILLLTGLPGLACFLLSFGICFFTCWEVQSWACTLVCV